MKPLAAAAAAAFLASCANTPPPAPVYDEVILVSAVAADGHSSIEGIQCSILNERGRWLATTPAAVRVERSDRALDYECTGEGYRPVSGIVPCTRIYASVRQGEPPDFSTQVGAAAVVFAAGGIWLPSAGPAWSPEGRTCAYGPIRVTMVKEQDP